MKKSRRTIHNRRGCRCPKGSDIRFCLGLETPQIDKLQKLKKQNLRDLVELVRSDVDEFELSEFVSRCLDSYADEVRKETLESVILMIDLDGDYETEDILGILGTRHLDGEVHKGRNQLRKEIINKLQTLIAAKQNGYQYIGIELEPEYIKIAKARLGAVPEMLL